MKKIYLAIMVCIFVSISSIDERSQSNKDSQNYEKKLLVLQVIACAQLFKKAYPNIIRKISRLDDKASEADTVIRSEEPVKIIFDDDIVEYNRIRYSCRETIIKFMESLK